MAWELPHKGYLRRSREHVGHQCAGRMAAAQRRRGSYAQKPTTDTPGRRRIFGRCSPRVEPRRRALSRSPSSGAKNTLSGCSLRQGVPAPRGLGIAQREAAVEAAVAKARAAITRLERDERCRSEMAALHERHRRNEALLCVALLCATLLDGAGASWWH